MKLFKSEKSVQTNAELGEKGSALPYVLAWMLGVPGSILFLIFILRSVF